MAKNTVHAEYLQTLLRGDRKASRSVVEKVLQTGTPAVSVYGDVIWPIMAEIERLLREDKITPTQEHLATRINRTIVDQLQNKLPRKAIRNKKIVICCPLDELQELGAQIIADMFESDGWEVKFLGGGLNNDDLLAFVHEYCPNILLIYGATPKQAPGIRRLIDTIKGINACPDIRIMVSGGLFNRAEGLWQEIGADLYAATAAQAIEMASGEKPIETQSERTINRRKRKRQQIAKELAQVK